MKKINDAQRKIIDKKNIKYGKQKLYDIMEHNKGNAEAIYITYKVSKILKAKKDIYICNDSLLKKTHKL